MFRLDISMIVDLIGSVGFPIVCCGVLFWFINKHDNQHKEEINALRESIENNTQRLSDLVEKLAEKE